MSQINPKRMRGNDLYNFTKGAKNLAISPVEVNRRALDGLHMDINTKESFKKMAVRAIATCPLNSDYIPDEFEPPQDKDYWPELNHFEDVDQFLQDMIGQPEKEMEKIYKKIMEKRHSGGNWLPYFNSWYVFCDGVICCH